MQKRAQGALATAAAGIGVVLLLPALMGMKSPALPAFLPIHDGRLLLGTWQGIALVECDGPRDREIVIDVRQ